MQTHVDSSSRGRGEPEVPENAVVFSRLVISSEKVQETVKEWDARSFSVCSVYIKCAETDQN